MSYASLNFGYFVFIVFLLYYIVPINKRWYILLGGSIIFYLICDIEHTIFLFGAIILSYFSAIKIEKSTNEKGRKGLLICTISVLVGSLVFLKFFDYSMGVLEYVFQLNGITVTFPNLGLILPIGISFYTLQIIGYLIDVYRRQGVSERNIAKYILFVSFFPIIVQGPISKFEQLQQQLIQGHHFNYNRMTASLQIILWGLLKKVVIADGLAIFVNNVYGSYEQFYGILLYITMILYSIQLYMDFSGCVDICRGVSGLFGINLIENFTQPYFAISIKDFWHHWHISLSTWLRDYVYIPLGGNRKDKIRKYVNLMVTFLVSGLWHGAGLNFIVWGGIHGGYQIIGEISGNIRSKVKSLLGIQENSFSEIFYKNAITFHLVAFAWIFFRSQDLNSACRYIYHMFSKANMWIVFDGTLTALGLSIGQLIVIIGFILIVFVVEFFQKYFHIQFRERIKQCHVFIYWTIYLVLILSIVCFGIYGVGYNASDFIYGGF